MIHIPKQQWMGCAVATAAMLADRSYEQVAAHWPDLDEARMRTPQQLCALLEGVTNIEWRFFPCWYPQPRVREFVPGQCPVAVLINDSHFRTSFSQWIVVEGEVIHDPGEWTAHTITSYPLRDWVVTLVVEPRRPVELAIRRSRKLI